MPTHSRALSESKLYHITVRGQGRQTIFEDDRDYQHYLDKLEHYGLQYQIAIHCYCLMSNHAHLLLMDPVDNLSRFMQAFETCYAKYFNKRHQHVGAVFQGRFAAQPITTDEQYLTTFRYVLQNPVKAGIAAVDTYPWNSYKDLTCEESESRITDPSLASNILGSLNLLLDFIGNVSEASEDKSFKVSRGYNNAEVEITQYAESNLNMKASAIKGLSFDHRNTVMRDLKRAGFSVRQIERATGIGRNIIQRA